jgi:predicted ATP-dependent endonuclease of OLD family
MFLKLKGIGKIRDSQIELRGITVIAGENNTGKSTFGKTLYCMFNAFCNAASSIYDERAESIKDILERSSLFDSQVVFLDKLINDVLLLKEAFSTDSFRRVMLESAGTISDSDIKRIDEIVKNCTSDIEQIVFLSDEDIQKTIVTQHFRNEFAGQINHINNPDAPSAVTLGIKGNDVEVSILKNECSAFSDKVGILHDATYIDTPFVLDDAQRNYIHFYYNANSGHRYNLLGKMLIEEKITPVAETIIKQKLVTLLASIDSVVNGDFKKTPKNGLTFVDQNMRRPVMLSNVSAGLKTFLIIKRLLEAGKIKEHGVLILDEPEIHLHPELQIKFAEILVLLQKELDLTILLTTHSPYFLNAIEIYSKKHGITDKCNYYLAVNREDTSDVQEVTGNIDRVYKQLAEPFQKLEDAAYDN